MCGAAEASVALHAMQSAAERASAAGEAWGESLVVESLVGDDAGEAVVGVTRESGASGSGVTHRGRFLEGDVDAAAGGVFDGLLGPVVEAVGLQPAAGRPHGGGVGHTGAGARATHPFDRRMWPRSTRRTMEGGIDCVWVSGWQRVCTCVCERGSVLEGPRKEVLGKGTREGTCSLFDASGKRARKEMLGKGPRKERARFLTQEGTCKGRKCSARDKGRNMLAL